MKVSDVHHYRLVKDFYRNAVELGVLKSTVSIADELGIPIEEAKLDVVTAASELLSCMKWRLTERKTLDNDH